MADTLHNYARRGEHCTVLTARTGFLVDLALRRESQCLLFIEMLRCKHGFILMDVFDCTRSIISPVLSQGQPFSTPLHNKALWRNCPVVISMKQ